MEAAAPISKNYARNLKKNINRTFSSPINNYQNGILQTPPILYHSFLAHQKQPPLLPLPISKSSVVPQHYNNHINTLSRNRGISLPPINKNVKSTKKSKLFTSSPEKPNSVMVVSSTNPLGPDPKDLPRDVSMVLFMSSTGEKERLSSRCAQGDANRNQLSPKGSVEPTDVSTVLSVSSTGSVVFTTVSPPPSSLPLPTFSLRPKFSCNIEASAGVDAGATDNLRRLLRLR